MRKQNQGINERSGYGGTITWNAAIKTSSEKNLSNRWAIVTVVYCQTLLSTHRNTKILYCCQCFTNYENSKEFQNNCRWTYKNLKDFAEGRLLKDVTFIE